MTHLPVPRCVRPRLGGHPGAVGRGRSGGRLATVPEIPPFARERVAPSEHTKTRAGAAYVFFKFPCWAVLLGCFPFGFRNPGWFLSRAFVEGAVVSSFERKPKRKSHVCWYFAC